MICPVTTSLGASPSQTIKQDVCFPRFVITRARCSCLSASFQGARAANTSSATCVILPRALQHFQRLQLTLWLVDAHRKWYHLGNSVAFLASPWKCLCPVGLEEAASTLCPGWCSLGQGAAVAALSLGDGSGSVMTPVCHVRNFMCSSCKSPQQMSDGLCKLGLDFTSGNGDGAASPQLGSRQR